MNVYHTLPMMTCREIEKESPTRDDRVR
jgi:hypothetical protein